MEAAALLGLVGLGYLVAKTAGPSTTTTTVKKPEGFVSGSEKGDPTRQNPSQYPRGILTNMPKGASSTGSGAELDLMFKTPNGQVYPSEPNPGPYGILPPGSGP